jgi:autotransporter-associated beta strand protein
MRNMKKSSPVIQAAVAAAVIALVQSSASAQNKVWTGATNATYGTASNWVFPNGNAASAPNATNEDGIFTSAATTKSLTLGATSAIRKAYVFGGDYSLDTNSQTFNLGGGFVNFGSGGFTVSGNTNLSGGLALTGTGTGALTFNGTIAGPVATGAFTKLSPGALNLKGAYTNASTLSFNGGITTLSNSASFNQTGAVTIGLAGGSGQQAEGVYHDPTGAALVLDNTAVNNQDRIASTFTNASNVTTVLATNFTQGGLLHLKGHADGTNEVLGTLSLNGSPGVRIAVDTASPASTAQLTFASLGSSGLVQVLSNNTLGGNSRVVFGTTAPALSSGVLRYGIVKDASTTGAAFATYDAANGVIAFTGTNGDINTATSTTNINLTGDASLTAARTVSTLAINGGSSTNLGNFNLTLGGATGLLLNTTSDYDINGGTGSLVLGGGSYVYANSNKLTVNANVTNNGLNKSGAGLLEVAGRFTSNGGGVGVDKSFAVPQSSTAAANDDMRISGVIAGTSVLTKNGFGQLALTGSSDNSAFAAGTQLNAGTLVLAKTSEALQSTALGSGTVAFVGGSLAARGSAATIANRVTLGNAAGPQHQLLGDQNITFTGIVTGAQNGGQNYFLFNNSTGTVTFAGRLQANSADRTTATSNGFTLAGSGYTVVSNGLLNGGFNPDGTEFAGSSIMVTNFTKQGSGTLEVAGVSTNTGTTRLEAGYLRLSSAGALSSGTNLFIGEQVSNYGQNAVLELGTGNSTFTRTIGTAANQVQFSGNSAGFASVAGTSTVSLGVGAVPNGQIVWGSTAQFLSGGSLLTLGSAGTAGTVDFTNPINLNNGNRTIRALNGAAAVDGILSGVISDPGTAGNFRQLTKDGAGGLALTNANTYGGGTIVSAGSLFANNSTGSATGNGAVNVTGGTLGGSGNIAGAVTVGTATFAPGNSIESLATGTLNLNNGSIFAYEAQDTSATGADLADITGSLNLTGTVTLTLAKLGAGTWAEGDKLTLASYTGTQSGLFTYGNEVVADDSTIAFDGMSWLFNYDDTLKGNNYSSEATGTFVTMTAAVAAVPEPTSLAFLGLAGLAGLTRRRRAN